MGRKPQQHLISERAMESGIVGRGGGWPTERADSVESARRAGDCVPHASSAAHTATPAAALRTRMERERMAR